VRAAQVKKASEDQEKVTRERSGNEDSLITQ
jgi:hypothetical protein